METTNPHIHDDQIGFTEEELALTGDVFDGLSETESDELRAVLEEAERAEREKAASESRVNVLDPERFTYGALIVRFGEVLQVAHARVDKLNSFGNGGSSRIAAINEMAGSAAATAGVGRLYDARHDTVAKREAVYFTNYVFTESQYEKGRSQVVQWLRDNYNPDGWDFLPLNGNPADLPEDWNSPENLLGVLHEVLASGWVRMKECQGAALELVPNRTPPSNPATLATPPEFESARAAEEARVNRAWMENEWRKPRQGAQVQPMLFELDEVTAVDPKTGQAAMF